MLSERGEAEAKYPVVDKRTLFNSWRGSRLLVFPFKPVKKVDLECIGTNWHRLYGKANMVHIVVKEELSFLVG